VTTLRIKLLLAQLLKHLSTFGSVIVTGHRTPCRPAPKQPCGRDGPDPGVLSTFRTSHRLEAPCVPATAAGIAGMLSFAVTGMASS
jgi:hypothetical protein